MNQCHVALFRSCRARVDETWRLMVAGRSWRVLAASPGLLTECATLKWPRLERF